MKFDLKTPCNNCPFRTDVKPYLRPRRAIEISNSIAEGLTFSCHKTNEFVDDEDGFSETLETENSQHCAGALILLVKEETPHQFLRIVERLGLFDPSKLDMKAPVYKSANKMIAAYRKAWRKQ